MVSMDDAERYVSGVKTEVAVARTRERVAALHADLARRDLPFSTLSERVADAELFVIRPADVVDDELAPQNMMLCTLSGSPVPATPGSDGVPPADTALHARLLREVGDVHAVVHLETGHAASWAARGEAIPCVTTLAADEFGGIVPVVGTPRADEDEIASAIAASLAAKRPRAVLVPHLGAFCVGETAREAVRLALVLEATARTAALAASAGSAASVPDDVVDRRYSRSHASVPQITDDRR